MRRTDLPARAAILFVSLGALLLPTVPVSLAAPSPNLTVSPTTLTFTYQIGGTIPAAQTISVSADAPDVNYTASASGGSWLTALPVHGTTPGSVTISISPQGLAVGVYGGDVIIAAPDAGNSPQIVLVNLTVIDPNAPQLTAAPSTLAFSYTIGDTAPAIQSVSIDSGGAGFNNAVTALGGTWLSVTPSNGPTPGNVGVSVDATGLTPGTYTGSVSITAPGAGNTPLTVPVSFAVAAAGLPNLSASPATLSFSYQVGGAIPAAQTVSVTSSGTALGYTASAANPWLTALPVNGTTPGSLSVSVSPQGLAAGVYSGDVIVASTGAGNPAQIVTVNLTVVNPAAPQLTASPSSLTFNYTLGATAPTAQNLAVGSSGSALTYSVSASGGTWLSVSSNNGTTPGSVSVSVNTTGLGAGIYTASVSITANGAGNTPLIVPVSLNITSGSLSNLAVSPATLSFTYQIGGSLPAAQAVSVTAGSVLTFTASASGDDWLSALPVNGTTPGNVSVSVSPQGLAAGVYSGSVILGAVGAGNSPQVVPVYLTVVPSPAPSLTAAPGALTFIYQAGTTAPAAQLLTVASSGSVLRYAVSTSGGAWLSATPAGGLTPEGVGVYVNTTGLAVGTYTGSVTVTALGSLNGAVTVPVTLMITLGNITPTPPSLAFFYTVGGTAPTPLTVSFASNGAALSYTVSAPSWLTVTPTTGTTPGSVSVAVNTTGLTPGTYTGSVSVTAANSGNSPQSTAVTLTVVPPSITTSSAQLNFSYTLGGTAPGSQTLTIGSTGTALSYTATASGGTWLSLSPASGTTSSNVTVSVNVTGLTAGTYNGTVTIAATGAANTPVTVPVTLTVSLPRLTATPSTLTFTYSITTGTAPAAQSVSITSNGTPLTYTVAKSATWLAISSTSGTTPGSTSVSIVTTGLAAGTYTGSLTITATGAGNSPLTVSVTLTVSP
jgi:hypothetical protein